MELDYPDHSDDLKLQGDLQKSSELCQKPPEVQRRGRVSSFTLTSVQVINNRFLTPTSQLSSSTMATMSAMFFSSDLTVLKPTPSARIKMLLLFPPPSCQDWGRSPDDALKVVWKRLLKLFINLFVEIVSAFNKMLEIWWSFLGVFYIPRHALFFLNDIVGSKNF